MNGFLDEIGKEGTAVPFRVRDRGEGERLGKALGQERV